MLPSIFPRMLGPCSLRSTSSGGRRRATPIQSKLWNWITRLWWISQLRPKTMAKMEPNILCASNAFKTICLRWYLKLGVWVTNCSALTPATKKYLRKSSRPNKIKFSLFKSPFSKASNSSSSSSDISRLFYSIICCSTPFLSPVSKNRNTREDPKNKATINTIL